MTSYDGASIVLPSVSYSGLDTVWLIAISELSLARLAGISMTSLKCLFEEDAECPDLVDDEESGDEDFRAVSLHDLSDEEEESYHSVLFRPVTASFVPDVKTVKSQLPATAAVDMPPPVAYNKKDFENNLSASWDRVGKAPTVSFLWDSNPFLKSVLGSGTSACMHTGFAKFQGLPPICPSVVPLFEECPRKTFALKDKLIFARAVKKMRNISWPETEDINRAKALARWKAILDLAPTEFSIGRIILGDLAEGAEPLTLEKVLHDVFVHKATKTLLSRSGAFLTFLHYCKQVCVSPFPITESIVYQYFCKLRLDSAASSKAASFKSCLAFALGMLGLNGVQEILDSSRISGAVFDQMLTRKPLKQRRALLAEEIYRLEMICRTAVDVRDRVFSGFMLFLAYGRVRNSDTYSCIRILWDFVGVDEGFVQVDVADTKTSRSIAKRNRFLPCICPRLGLSDEPWTDAWRLARDDAGLSTAQFTDAQFPLMPAPLLTGGWSDRPLSASEVRRWLAELLQIGDEEVELDHLGSHSGKATLLSWMSKVGASPAIRRHLGYHVEPGDVTMLTYSRDAAAEPLRQLNKMIMLIRTGHFNPDKSRSGYMSPDLRAFGFDMWIDRDRQREYEEAGGSGFPSSGARTVRRKTVRDDCVPDLGDRPPVQEASNSKPPGICDSDSSSDDESAVVDQLIDELVPACSPLLGVDQVDLELGNLYFHTTFCTVHRISEFYPTRFKCGRELRPAYDKLTVVTFDWPKCKDCFPPNRV